MFRDVRNKRNKRMTPAKVDGTHSNHDVRAHCGQSQISKAMRCFSGSCRIVKYMQDGWYVSGTLPYSCRGLVRPEAQVVTPFWSRTYRLDPWRPGSAKQWWWILQGQMTAEAPHLSGTCIWQPLAVNGQGDRTGQWRNSGQGTWHGRLGRGQRRTGIVSGVHCQSTGEYHAQII